MAWSISISNEGWQEIYETCHEKSKTFLFRAINEARSQSGTKKLPQKSFKIIAQEALADEVYEWIQRTNTCDNGGFKYWIDSKGYYKIEISGKD